MKVLAYINGKKTYIVAIASVIYGALVYAKVPGVPGPKELGDMMITIGLLAVGFRSAIQKGIDALDVIASK